MKNVRMIAGRPLFHWILMSLDSSSLIEQIAVETDSDQIAESVAEAFPHVAIFRRPPELLGDMVPMHDIVANFATQVDASHILQTHTTNPLLRPSTIDAAIRTYLEPGQHDSLMSVTPRYSRFYTVKGDPINHDPEALIRTQDLTPLLEEDSNIYLAPRDLIVARGRRIGERPLLFTMEASESIDIDDEFDFVVAEWFLQERRP